MQADERLLFSNFTFKRFPNGMCRAEVELQRQDSVKFVGTAQSSGSAVGSMRAAAEASAEALQKAVPEGPSFEILGVKATGAFDSTIVIVSIRANGGGLDVATKLVGSYVTQESRERAAAIAVLNATNRYLQRDIMARA